MDSKDITQVMVDLQEIAYQCGDTKDRQGEYIQNNINAVINLLRRFRENETL